MSSTVTLASTVETFPLTSVTVNVTMLFPTLAQLNAFGATLKEAIPQASFEPLFTSVAVIETFPLASN